jgi:hypothetical protein
MKKYLLILFLFCAVPAVSHAQGCSVCTKTAQGLDNKSAKGLNGGIIYLAFLPLGIMGTLTFLWWRSNKGAIRG